MKVQRDENQFKPITITIETLDELATLYHRINMSNNTFKKAYSMDGMAHEKYKDVSDDMWRALFDGDKNKEGILK